MPTGQVFPDDIQVVEQRMPVPFMANFEIGIWASNQDQHYQILEQILMLFDPQLQIQINDELFDWRKITTVTLTDIRFDENLPAATDRRLIRTFLMFDVPVHLAVPTKVHQKFIKDIYVRIGAVSSDIGSNYDILSDLDAQGIEYEQIFSLDDITIDE